MMLPSRWVGGRRLALGFGFRTGIVCVGTKFLPCTPKPCSQEQLLQLSHIQQPCQKVLSSKHWLGGQPGRGFAVSVSY